MRIILPRSGKSFLRLFVFSSVILFLLGCFILKSTLVEGPIEIEAALPLNGFKDEGVFLPAQVEEAEAEAESRIISSSVAPLPLPRPPEPTLLTDGGQEPDEEVETKRLFIKKMMEDAWSEYEKYAWGYNELMPNQRKGRNGGEIYGYTNFGATIIDSLGTLHIMGLTKEFQRARDWVAQHFNFSRVCYELSLFEANIRIVGGFLSAYALTNDTLFLEKAEDVAKKLLPAFETPSGIPHPRVSPCHGTVSGSGIALAELGSLHLEFVYLSALTKNPIYYDKVYKIREQMRKVAGRDSVYNTQVRVHDGAFATSEISIGAGADSFYEYLIKSWIQTGKTEDLEMYHSAIQGMIKEGMMQVSPGNHFLYFGQSNGYIQNSFSHLACFAGAMFALGSVSDSQRNTAQRDMEIAKNITNTCHESYIRTKTKIGPETFRFDRGPEATNPDGNNAYYILRPEVIESYFTLYRLTGDPKYRDWGWDAALAIEKYCKARDKSKKGGGWGERMGYSGIQNVNKDPPGQDDVQQTFFLAETLKYLYLLFSSPKLIDLDNWVFNTEAHPLPIRGKNPMFPVQH